MFRRAVSLRARTESVWRAITEPGSVEDWFGAQVEWDLRPGGEARFRTLPARRDGTDDRRGIVERVEPGRHLRFRWWPASDETDVTEISYDLEPGGDDSTTLTVTERPLRPETVPAHDGTTAMSSSATVATAWSAADQRHFEVWAATATVAVGAGR